MTSVGNSQRHSWILWLGWILFFGLLVISFALGLLGTSITIRRVESISRPPLQPIAEGESDSSKWAVNYPRQYDRYRRMLESDTRTKFGGSFPRDYLEETPTLVILFAGVGFAKDYLQARGHTRSREDVLHTKRLTPASPGTCWTCKSADVPRLLLTIPPERFYSTPFKDLAAEMNHPVGCLDCHDPATMQLTITRPALKEALIAQGRDLTTISHQEMRSLVCAQCHVEYYFRPEDKYLIFPWEKGTSLEAIETYYEERNFADWTHSISKTPLVKIQHPDYELYLTGIHAYRNVACADCHMPYRTEGGTKFTDHHVRSPLLNIHNSCQVCHRWSEEEIRTRVEGIQSKIRSVRDLVETNLCEAHLYTAAAMESGATEQELAPIRAAIRKAHIRWDFVAAANGMGFHSPAESLRILAEGLHYAHQAKAELTRLLTARGISLPLQLPSLDSKSAAQALEQQFTAGQPPKLLP